jgi:hypothetical protein
MGRRLGHDFARVRVHTNERAGRSALALNAAAYTVANDVVFAPGRYAPDTVEGDRLLTHELVHVVQQQRAGGLVQRQAEGPSDDEVSSDLRELSAVFVAARDALLERQGTDPAAVGAEDAEQLGRLDSALEQLSAMEASGDRDARLEIVEHARELLAARGLPMATPSGVSPQRRALELGSRGDSQESEAEAIAKRLAGTNDETVVSPTEDPGRRLRRAAPALAIGAAAAAGPPGWLVLGVAAVAVVGVAYVASRTRAGARDLARAEPRVIPRREQPAAAMRFQVQWDTARDGPTFSSTATAPASVGVSTIQAVAGLASAHGQVSPRAAHTASAPAVVAQAAWVRARPPAGITTGGRSKSEYFRYRHYTDARVDVENLRGWNLRT